MARIALLLLALVVSACTNAVDVNGPLIDGDASGEQAVVLDEELGLSSERIYFGVDNVGATTDEMPWFYGDFALSPGARTRLRVAAADGSNRPVGFNVYRVMDGGSFRFVGRHEARGGAVATLTSRVGGTFVLETWGNGSVDALRVVLECTRRDGNCAPQQQPGELCGTRGSGVCDDGLYCAFTTDCGRADQGGSCTKPAQMCPAVVGPEVCGCNGQTYGTACQASSAGIAVDHEGPCPCNPEDFTKVTDGSAHVVGTWTAHDVADDGTHVRATLQLRDGDFTYEQIHEPACLFADPPCRVATRMYSATGTWVDHGFAVQLVPTTSMEPFMATTFGIERNCQDEVRLTTTEAGRERVLARDPCSDVTCADGLHCELRDVQCVRAPCPQAAVCVGP